MTSAVCRDCIVKGPAPYGQCAACGSRRVVAHDELDRLAIAHIDCDAFYASVEKRDDASLRDKPVIVGHAGGRGVVTTACYVARRFGIRSAMPMFKALEACPGAVVIPPDMAKYKQASNVMRDIFRAATPVIEPVSLDEAYLDLTAEVRHDGRPVAVVLADVASMIERDVGITVSIGLSANKFLAKIASDLIKPRGFSVIGMSEARDVLRPMSVRKINGVGQATAERLEAAGVMTIGDLQRMSEGELIGRFGNFGRRLAGYAIGEDVRSVTSYRRSKSVSAETTFRADTASVDELRIAAERLCARLADRLERSGFAAGAVVLKLKTTDFQVLSRTQQLVNPTRRADLLLRAAALLIDKEADGRAFRLIGIGAGDLVSAEEADQPDLFGN